MNELLDQLREDFKNEDARYAYAEGFLNASIAAQIKTLRGEMSQEVLADRVGTKQSGISRLENVNYSAWKVETLRKLARAFGLRLRISFEEFGTLIPEIENFRRGTLQRRKFEEDPAFKEPTGVEEPEQEKSTSGVDVMLSTDIPDLTVSVVPTAFPEAFPGFSSAFAEPFAGGMTKAYRQAYGPAYPRAYGSAYSPAYGVTSDGRHIQRKNPAPASIMKIQEEQKRPVQRITDIGEYRNSFTVEQLRIENVG